jgi:heterodisulfide reductase subunit A
LVATLSLAEGGFEVELVEKSGVLGGHSTRLHSLLDGSDFRVWLQDLINRVEEKPSVHLWKETEVAEVAGCAGDFRATVKQRGNGEYLIEAGAIIVATGAEELQPTEYGYGEAREVLTQLELEEKLATGEIKPAELKSVVMIQCVGSRDEQRPYCSRVCCSQAVKNALNLRKQNPELRVTIFYRDMMTYGLREEYYTAAREQGIEFVRYELDQKPGVALKGGKPEIRAREPVLGGELVLQPDLLVLSPAIVPGDNVSLSRRLGVELDEDGFFREAELKFRPVDFLKEGIYVCGLAHSPRNVAETIVQAQAAAQRAAQLLSRELLVPPTAISEVNERWCTGCELCVKVCPFEARYKAVDKRVVQVREALCRGCGACAAACPSGAAQLRELTDRQLISMLDAAL